MKATYASRLPLAVYVVGAAVTVALSFIFVIVRDVRAAPPDLTAEAHLPPAWIRWPLRVLGLAGRAWILAQGIAGGPSRGDARPRFRWAYCRAGRAHGCARLAAARACL